MRKDVASSNKGTKVHMLILIPVRKKSIKKKLGR